MSDKEVSQPPQEIAEHNARLDAELGNDPRVPFDYRAWDMKIAVLEWATLIGWIVTSAWLMFGQVSKTHGF